MSALLETVAVPGTAAVAEPAVQTLLRCWARETGWSPEPPLASLPLIGADLRVPVLARSVTGWHRFGVPTTADGAPIDAGLLAALLTRAGAARLSLPDEAALPALVRFVDSAVRTAGHVRHRAGEDPAVETGLPPFLAAEQALVVGHPFHPAAKARGEASDAELADWSPERRGAFALHWFAADADLVASGSAHATSVVSVLRRLPGSPAVPTGTVPLPLHPWQAREARRLPAVQELLAAGRLVDVGPAGSDWSPTSSVRTVWCADADVQLKLSLGMRITNSRRVNLRSELRLGVTAARLWDGGLSARFPAFRIVRDPAWVGLDDADGRGIAGFDTAIRDNPFDRTSPVCCVAGLLDERPDRRDHADRGSGLARLLRRSGRSAEEWFATYLTAVAAPLLDLFLDHGLALEAHHQNTLVSLDRDGLPLLGWYRDSQGYWVTESSAERLLAPLGDDYDPSSLVFADALVAERFTYYLLVNNLLGVVGALGSEGLGDETRLLRLLRTWIEGRDAKDNDLLASWLDAPRLRTKANLLTTVDGRDELVGHPASQSVYVDIPNPVEGIR